jgi:putative serine protease PepD
MSDNKSHYNTQFLGEQVKLPQPVQVAPAPKAKASTTLILVAVLGPLLGVFVGASAIGGVLPLLSGPSQVVVNNPGSVNWVTGAAAKALPSVVTLSVSGKSSTDIYIKYNYII